MAAVPELRGDRIVLNAHTDQDAAAHVAGEDEETARRFGWWPQRSTEQGVRAAYADWARDWHDDGPRRTFAARDPDTGALVGGCELRIRPDGAAEVSYWTHAAQRGRGHAQNALTLLAGYAASIGVTRLEAHIAPGNHASRHVAEAAGFTQAGTVIEDGIEMIRYTRQASCGQADALTARARELWESLAAAAAGCTCCTGSGCGGPGRSPCHGTTCRRRWPPSSCWARPPGPSAPPRNSRPRHRPGNGG
jgi:RimJ/RimL family protein N-acetyltransferase